MRISPQGCNEMRNRGRALFSPTALILLVACAGQSVPVAPVHSASVSETVSKTPAGADPIQRSRLLISDAEFHDLKKGSIYVAQTGGGGKTLLTNDGVSPNWTPDGHILFVSQRSGSPQIWIMDENGGNPRQIGQLDTSAARMPLMPQQARGGLILFQMMTAQGLTSIWTMHGDGSNPSQLVASEMRPSQPSLALSGTWATYTVETDNPYHREIWRINTDGSGAKQLTFLGDADYPDANASSISPDETMVAFFSGKESDQGAAGLTQSPFTWGHRNIAVIAANGGARRTVTACKPVTSRAAVEALRPSDCIAADNPAWLPDGQRIIYDTNHDDTWMIDVNGQNARRIWPKGRGLVRVPLKYVN